MFDATAEFGPRPGLLVLTREGAPDSVRPANGFWLLKPPAWFPPCPKPVETEARDTVGRVPERAGGIAAERPAPGPSIAIRVGAIFTRPMGALASCLPETRTAVPRTGTPFAKVRLGTAVKPPGALIFA